MNNVIIIHSYNGDTENSFAPSIKLFCKENGIKYYFPKFPTRSIATYESWEKILNEYKDKGIINENSIIIAHSLGTHFVPKYLARNNVKVNIYISVAGFLNYSGRRDLENIIKKFLPTGIEFEKCKNMVRKIYAIYSDNDEVSPLRNLEDYANMLSAKKILIKGAGHFNPKSNIIKIEEINNIILNSKK